MIRIFSHYVSARVIILLLGEALLLFASIFAGADLRFASLHPAALPPLTMEAFLFAFFMILIMSAVGLYQQDHYESFQTTVFRMGIAFLFGTAIMSVVFYLIPETYIGRGLFAITSIVAFFSIFLFRWIFTKWPALGFPKRRVLLLGVGEDAQTVLNLFNTEQHSATEIVGIHALSSRDIVVNSDKILQPDISVLEAVKRFNVHDIVVAVRERREGALPVAQLLDCKLRGIQITEISTFFERELGQIKLDTLKASWLIFGEGCRRGLVRETIKRVFDIIVSASLLILALPIMFVTALLIVYEDNGPVFYRQERVGQGGRVFHVLKFRSMRLDAERDGKPRWAQNDDARTTRVGRFIRSVRIDELPQIINVLRGEMSFVGPRPERPFFVRQFEQEIPFYAARHSVKPGITGWAQVRYSYCASLQDTVQKLQYDLYYVKNHTLFLDLLILIETVQVVIWGKGAR